MASKSISIPVTGNTAPLRQSLTRAERDLQRFANDSKAKMKSAASAFAVAGAAVGGMGVAIYSGFQKAEQANKRVAQIAKSMGLFGMQTGQVVRRLQELGDQLERETGLTAESIKETQAKLLTFSQIAKTADEAGGAFDRATKAAIDMGAAGFGEATMNAVQLGKALQDPIKGVTALARSGITFTTQEREKIRTLVESNRMLEAQDMILSAVEQQVQGTAAATATATTKMKNSLGEITDLVGEALAPAFDAGAVEMQKFSAWATKNAPLVAAVTVAVGGLTVALFAVKAVMATATAVSAAYALAQTGLASANLAVQISTGIGIATAAVALAAIVAMTAKVYGNAKALREQAAATSQVTTETGIMKNMIDRGREANEKAAAAEAAATEKQNKAAEAEKTRYANLKKGLADAKQAIRAYVQEISTAINSQVNLGAAFSEAANSQTDSTERLNEALKERREAYAVLQQAQATGSANDYANALDGVAKAEQNVSDAQAVKPKNYAAIFAEQIAAAKAFAGYVGQLAKAGLSKAGLGQILDLGPVAGAQVAKDLLAGTSGMSISGLNKDLAEISATGTAAGMSIPGFTEALNTTVGRTGPGDYYITIQAGVSSPTDIAQTVTTVLKDYGAKTGGVDIKVKRPKASTGRRRK
jgi:hypothetical protein